MEEKITFAILGLGNRGEAYLNALEKNFRDKYKIVAICDVDKEKLANYKVKYNLSDSQIYCGYVEFMKAPKLADVIIITTLDAMHYLPAIDAIKKDYHLILEKPIAMTLDEVLTIGKEAKNHPNKLIAVCHVLRHTSFFKTIKQIIDSKELGEVVNIQHNENVGYYHFAHSYVRGNWRNDSIAAPFIVAKSCHDMDIMLYLLGDKHCKKLSSFGSLSYFTHQHYDETKMASRCVDCSINKTCPYSALSIYKDILNNMPNNEMANYMLHNSPYGRCVYDCDNNVPDHQVSILEFDNGITATFNLSAFTNYINRSLKIMCELGEIRATETTREIEVHHFGSSAKKVIVPYENALFSIKNSGHGGGDDNFIINFMNSILYHQPFDSTLDMSIESHVMAFKAEESRLNNGKVMEIDKIMQNN
jgi:predicted dehydrogenase